MKFLKTLKDLLFTNKTIEDTSKSGELDHVDWAKILRNFLFGLGLTALAYTIEYLNSVDLTKFAAWVPAAVPFVIMLLQAIQKKLKDNT